MSQRGDEEIRFERRGGIVRVVLNRPRALNALTHEMCRRLLAGLGEWQHDPAVGAVVIEGEGERAFCAGGDILRTVDAVERQGVEAAAGFFRTEYSLNARLYHFSKPWIALIDGIVMGGGVGISIHGSHRLATERTVFAMPETGIGFFPDVGGTWALPRLPGEVGMYLGLTGARLRAADCRDFGIATQVIESGRAAALVERLAALESREIEENLEAVLAEEVVDPGPGELAPARERIDACFGQPSLEGVLSALEADGSDFAAQTLAALRTKSPTSLRVAFEQLRRGRRLTGFDDAMRLEYRLVHRFLGGHDFREGVRALLIDKDGAPAWRPARIDEVDSAEVERYFAPLPGGDLELM